MFTISVFVLTVVGIVVCVDNSSILVDLPNVNVEITQYVFAPSLTVLCPETPNDLPASVLASEEFLFKNSLTLPSNVKLERFHNTVGTAYTPAFIISNPTVGNTGEYTCCYPAAESNSTESVEGSTTCYRTNLTVSESASFDLTQLSDNIEISVTLGRTNYFWFVNGNTSATSIDCKVGKNTLANVKFSVDNSYNQFVITNTGTANLAKYECTAIFNFNGNYDIIKKTITLTEAKTAKYPWNGLPNTAPTTNGAANEHRAISNIAFLIVSLMLFTRSFL